MATLISEYRMLPMLKDDTICISLFILDCKCFPLLDLFSELCQLLFICMTRIGQATFKSILSYSSSLGDSGLHSSFFQPSLLHRIVAWRKNVCCLELLEKIWDIQAMIKYLLAYYDLWILPQWCFLSSQMTPHWNLCWKKETFLKEKWSGRSSWHIFTMSILLL